MTALRKIVDSDILAGLFDLPPTLQNRRIEVVLFPAEEEKEDKTILARNQPLRFTVERIEEWARVPEIQALVGALSGTGLPADISINDIREQRLADKYCV